MPSNNKYLYDDTKNDWFKIALESDIDKEKTIVFVTNGKLENGIQNAHTKLKFDATVLEIDASVLKVGDENVEIQIQKTTDFTTWVNVLSTPVVIPSGQHSVSVDLSAEDIEINENEVLALNVLNGFNAENLSLNLQVLKK